MATVTVKLVSEPRGRRPGTYLVYHGSDVIGGLERHRNTRIESHPYKAYGINNTVDRTLTRFLGSFYERDGGKELAVEAIVNYYKINFTN
jgi:hypothetical protein